MQPHEVLLNVHIPFTKQHDFVREYKQAHRRDDDIAIANAGMRVRSEMAPDGNPPPPPSPHLWLLAEQLIGLGHIHNIFWSSHKLLGDVGKDRQSPGNCHALATLLWYATNAAV